MAARDSLGGTSAAPPSGKWILAAFVPQTAPNPWKFWSVPAAPEAGKLVLARVFGAHMVPQSSVYAAANWHAAFVLFRTAVHVLSARVCGLFSESD